MNIFLVLLVYVSFVWKEHSDDYCGVFIEVWKDYKQKLQIVKQALQIWNNEIFGNIHVRVIKDKEQLQHFQNLISSSNAHISSLGIRSKGWT